MKYSVRLLAIAALLLPAATFAASDDIAIGKANKAAPHVQGAYYYLKVEGAESVGVEPSDIDAVETFHFDALVVLAPEDFVRNISTGDPDHPQRDDAWHSEGWQRLTSEIRLISGEDKTPLQTPVYARFSNKDRSGGQQVALCESQSRLAAAEKLSTWASPIYEITDAQWAQKSNKLWLTLFMKALPQSQQPAQQFVPPADSPQSPQAATPLPSPTPTPAEQAPQEVPPATPAEEVTPVP